MTTAGKFQNFLWSRVLIIVQTVDMVTNRKCISRLNPSVELCNSTLDRHGGKATRYVQIKYVYYCNRHYRSGNRFLMCCERLKKIKGEIFLAAQETL